MKIITILNFKGGVGKSETTRNLAKGLVDQGYRVLVVDNDPQANTSKFLNGTKGIDKLDLSLIHTEEDLINVFVSMDSNGIYLEDLYIDPTNIKEAIQKTKVEKLDILSCSLNLANTDTILRLDTMKPQQDRIKKMLRNVRDDYDFCFIDCPPILNLLTINALIASNCECIIPIKIDAAGLQGWGMTAKFINSLKENYDLDIDYKVVFTMVDRSRYGWINSAKEIIDTFKRVIPNKTFHTVIRNQSAPVINSGFKSVFVIDDYKANIGNDYRDLVNDLKGDLINE